MPRKTQRPYWNRCGVPRTSLVRYASLNLATGESREDAKPAEWVTERCGTPLFSHDHEDEGMCRSCKAGWTHPNNFRVEGPIEPPDYRRAL